MMNITKAYTGALAGLHTHCYIVEARKVQLAICTQLALLRPRGSARDGDMVTDVDLRQLKPRKGRASTP